MKKPLTRLRKAFAWRWQRYVVKPSRRLFLLPARRTKYQRKQIAMITGTKGKTTTTRMLAHILRTDGRAVGLTSTNGILINGELVIKGDSSNYAGAHRVLSDDAVDCAVLETARGGLLQDGLYVDRCNVGALLNVNLEQIGIDGINTLEAMAEVKRAVTDAATGRVVLNADDIHCAALIDRYSAEKTAVFSIAQSLDDLAEHRLAGRALYVIENVGQSDECIVRVNRDSASKIIETRDIPAYLNGVLPNNLANALAATALAEGLGVSPSTITRALSEYRSDIVGNPGRFNLIEDYPFKVIIDAAVHVHTTQALVASLEKMAFSGKKICVMDNYGDRPDWHFAGVCKNLAEYFDEFFCFEHERYLRGRYSKGGITKMLREKLLRAGVEERLITCAEDPESATFAALASAKKGDLIVFLLASSDPNDVIPSLNAWSKHSGPD